MWVGPEVLPAEAQVLVGQPVQMALKVDAVELSLLTAIDDFIFPFTMKWQEGRVAFPAIS